MDEGVSVSVLESIKQLYLGVILGLMRQICVCAGEGIRGKTITGQKEKLPQRDMKWMLRGFAGMSWF